MSDPITVILTPPPASPVTVEVDTRPAGPPGPAGPAAPTPIIRSATEGPPWAGMKMSMVLLANTYAIPPALVDMEFDGFFKEDLPDNSDLSWTTARYDGDPLILKVTNYGTPENRRWQLYLYAGDAGTLVAETAGGSAGMPWEQSWTVVPTYASDSAPVFTEKTPAVCEPGRTALFGSRSFYGDTDGIWREQDAEPLVRIQTAYALPATPADTDKLGFWNHLTNTWRNVTFAGLWTWILSKINAGLTWEGNHTFAGEITITNSKRISMAGVTGTPNASDVVNARDSDRKFMRSRNLIWPINMAQVGGYASGTGAGTGNAVRGYGITYAGTSNPGYASIVCNVGPRNFSASATVTAAGWGIRCLMGGQGVDGYIMALNYGCHNITAVTPVTGYTAAGISIQWRNNGSAREARLVHFLNAVEVVGDWSVIAAGVDGNNLAQFECWVFYTATGYKGMIFRPLAATGLINYDTASWSQSVTVTKPGLGGVGSGITNQGAGVSAQNGHYYMDLLCGYDEFV